LSRQERSPNRCVEKEEEGQREHREEGKGEDAQALEGDVDGGTLVEARSLGRGEEESGENGKALTDLREGKRERRSVSGGKGRKAKRDLRC
jgi:hypothetical protein